MIFENCLTNKSRTYFLNSFNECFNVGNGNGTIQTFNTKHPLRRGPKLTTAKQTFIHCQSYGKFMVLTVDNEPTEVHATIDDIRWRNVAGTA